MKRQGTCGDDPQARCSQFDSANKIDSNIILHVLSPPAIDKHCVNEMRRKKKWVDGWGTLPR
jgi:hypothetical protein